jgi:hypothetical protein
MSIKTRTHIIYLFIVVLALAGGFLWGKDKQIESDTGKASSEVALAEQQKDKVIKFLNLFVNQVLSQEGDISFDSRLELENTVRDLNEPKILLSWNNFVASKDEQDAQKNVKDLLKIIADDLYVPSASK